MTPTPEHIEAVAKAIWMARGGIERIWDEAHRITVRGMLAEQVAACWRDARAALCVPPPPASAAHVEAAARAWREEEERWLFTWNDYEARSVRYASPSHDGDEMDVYPLDVHDMHEAERQHDSARATACARAALDAAGRV